jgi:hypothetical protein
MSNKIKMSKGAWGKWTCVIESDNGKGDFSEIKVGNEKGIYLDRVDLLELAIKKLGIDLEYVVDGKEVK